MAGNRFYWLKLKRDFFKRHDVMIIEGMPNGKDYVLFYLKLLCESVDHDGSLRFSETIPYNEQMLATITNTNIDTVRNAIKVFKQLDLIEILDDGTLYMNEVQKMLGSETEWAEKKRAYRETSRVLLEDREGQAEDNVPDNVRTQKDNVRQEIEKEKELEIEIEKEKKKRPAEPSVASVLASADLEENVKTALREFSKMRTKIKATMTASSMEKIIASLKRLSTDQKIQEAIVNQSVEKSWRGLYPLKEEKKQQQETPRTPSGKLYAMEQHPHDAQTDADIERALNMKWRK